jgi:hypothetical protein
MVINSGSRGSRLVWVRLKAQFCNLFIVSAYIPYRSKETKPHQQDTLDELQALLVSEASKGDCIFVMGDFNARLARSIKNITGKFCMHSKPDEGGERLTEIMQAANLVDVASHFCPKRNAPLGQATYRPKSKTHGPAQIDHILMSQKWLSSIRKSRVEWKHSLVRFGHLWDHGMVTADLQLRISKTKPREPQPDRGWLDDESNGPAFDEAYTQAKKAPENQTMDADFEQISSAISSALKLVPHLKTRKRWGGAVRSAPVT